MATEEQTPVDSTKLALPARHDDLIARPRVNAMLDAAAKRSVTVIRAAPGYGRTTALAGWLAARGSAVAWLSLDSDDNDPRRLAAHLFAACERALSVGPVELRDAFETDSDLMQSCLPLLGDALHGCDSDRLVLVLDDYHVITEARCHEFVSGCLDVLPPHVRAVLTSRTKPPRLARRLAARTLSRIGPEDLRLTAAESARLLNVAYALGLSARELAQVEASLRGWPAAVALLGGSLRRAGGGASEPAEHDLSAELAALDRGELADYVIAEILDRLPTAHARFAQRTAALDRLSGPLCTAVLDDAAAPELLDEVHLNDELMTTVEVNGGWLHVHDPIRRPLAVALARREPRILPVLHRRASVWFEQAGMIEDAIDHALAAHDSARAVQLLVANVSALLRGRRDETMRRTLEATAGERGDLEPFCEALDALLMLREGVDQRITHARADALIKRYGDRSDVRAVLDPVLVTPYYGDVARAAAAGPALKQPGSRRVTARHPGA